MLVQFFVHKKYHSTFLIQFYFIFLVFFQILIFFFDTYLSRVEMCVYIAYVTYTTDIYILCNIYKIPTYEH